MQPGSPLVRLSDQVYANCVPFVSIITNATLRHLSGTQLVLNSVFSLELDKLYELDILVAELKGIQSWTIGIGIGIRK